MAIHEYKGISPKIDSSSFIAESAEIIGDVTIGKNCSIWYNVTIRGDVAPIVIGDNVSIQDNSVVHVDDYMPTNIGNDVTVGHGAIVHAVTIEDNCLIGMGAILLDEARIGRGSLVGAGALVPPRKQISPRSQVMGAPCVITKELDEEREQGFIEHAQKYVRLKNDYL